MANSEDNVDGDRYFRNEDTPSDLAQTKQLVDGFVEYHRTAHRRVVLVTSGGTTVPLEKNTVRFLDNFSAGTRGACSAEYFHKEGYAVIFLHRQFSLEPYSRHYSHSTHCFLDYLQTSKDGHLQVDAEHQLQMLNIWRLYNQVKNQNLLLTISFVTISEYLFNLRLVAKCLRPLGPSAMFYLAAAVSDFHIPSNRKEEHKIQSRARQKLVVEMDPVPKFLKTLVDEWAPSATIVSFKLETDPSILVYKARQSLHLYNHSLVIGNLLQTRKYEVVLVTEDKEEWVKINDPKLVDVESLLIPRVKQIHSLNVKAVEIGSTQTQGKI